MLKRNLLWAAGALVLMIGGTLAAERLGAFQAPAAAKAGGKLYVAGVLSGVEAVDLETGRSLKRIRTGILPHNLLVSPDGKQVYVTNVGSQSVSVIDVATDTKVKDILVGEIPENAAHAKLDPARLKAANSCFECHTNGAVGSLPNALTWAGDGKHLLVNEFHDRTVTWLDPVAGKTVARKHFDLPTPSSPANMVVHPQTREVWVLHRWEKDTYQGQTGKARPANAMTDFTHDPPAGQHVSWVTVHDPRMERELGRIRMELAVPFGGVFSPDGSKLYVAYRSANRIAVFDTRTRTLSRTFTTSVAPTGLALSRDGRELYVTCVFSTPAVVQILDTDTGETKVSMGVPPSPSLVRLDPKTGRLYVTATGYNAVLEIDPASRTLLRELPSGHQPLDLVIVR